MSETTNTTPKPTGINAWIDKKAGAALAQTAGQGGQPLEIDLDLLDSNPKQPRQEIEEEALLELMESLKIYGLLQAITVTKQPNGRFVVLAGHRRVAAMKRIRDSVPATERARWSKIPATDRGATATDQLAELAITENLQRLDLRPMETAIALADLRDAKKLSTEQLAERLAIDHTKTKRYLQLAAASPAIRQAIGKGLMVEVGDPEEEGGKPRREHRNLELSHALQVLRASTHWTKTKPKKAADLTRALVEKVLAEGWPLRKLKDHVDDILGVTRSAPSTPDDGTGEEQATDAGPAPRTRLFQSDATRLTVHRAKLATASQDEKASLKAVLSELLSQLN